MDFFIQRLFKCKIGSALCATFSLLFFTSFPANSSSFITNSSASFGALGFAFVLGLSFPIIIFSLCGQYKDKYRLGFFLLSTVSLLAVVYLIAFTKPINMVYFSCIAIIYLVSLFFSCSLKKIALLSNKTILLPFGVSALYFLIAIFVWINKGIDHQWLLIHSVASYAVFLLASCWLIIKASNSTDLTKDINSTENKRDTNLSDSAINLPSQKQAFQFINNVIEHEPKTQLAVVVFKPINFQQMNKVLGYKNSDILLLQLTYSLQKSIESNEQLINFNQSSSPIRIAHLRGLHFLAVLKLDENEEGKELIVESLCKELTMAIPSAMSFKSFSLNFELTFGVSFINTFVNSLSQTVSHAEDALLSAKSNQKLMSYFSKDEILYTESYLVEMERLKQDIIDDNLHWYVQPQSRLKDRKLEGFELLVQWKNSEGDPVEFIDFVDTAEHSGEIYLLTKQMITRAFKLILKLQRVSNYKTVSIKLLSQSLLEPDLVSFIEGQIATYNVPAKYLVIELPENVVSSASERAKVIIDQLKFLKVKIAISNFSGSYESLRYIRKMTVDQIKIDCEHIHDAVNVTENVIITSLIELTKKMELPLIGTSINTKSVEQTFTLIGGELAQGNVVDKGVDFDNIDKWVTTWDKLYNPI